MLGAIAFQYGLTVEDLLAANPDIDPAFLTVGSTLVVPLEVDELQVEATQAPLPIHLDGPDCYPAGDGGAYCLMMATNEGEVSVENLTVKFGFSPEDGENLVEEIAIPPLNVLSPGESLPVLAFFPSPIEPGLGVRGEVVSAFPLLDATSRYPDAEVEVEEVIVEPDGLQATVQGQVILQTGGRSPDYLWLAAVAYGESGEVVGVRKWEAPQGEICPDLEMPAQPVEAETWLNCLDFDLTVFSLGPQIGHVEVHVEAGYQTDPGEAPW